MKNLHGDLTAISDEKLFQMARQFGSNALLWRRRFTGLLPEVDRRRLWEKKGYESVFVFGKKLAGLSEKQIRMVLNLERRFKYAPALKSLLVNGEVSVNKLARVASIATKENEEELAEKVSVLPKKAIEVFVRDEKLATNEESEMQNGFIKPKNDAKSLPGQTFDKLQISDEVAAKLLELQEKGIDVNEFLLDALAKRETSILQEKEDIAKELEETDSRYVPAKVQRIVQKEHGDKCSIPGCCKPASALHHTQAFALGRRHDPRFLAPLCNEHHAIAHSINVRASEMRQVQRA